MAQDPLEPFYDKTVRELTKTISADTLSEEEKERHSLFCGALSAILTYYWNGRKPRDGGVIAEEYPQNPEEKGNLSDSPWMSREYRGHNIAAIAVNAKGEVLDFDFNHNNLFDSSVEHAEARLVKRLFSLSQIGDSYVKKGSKSEVREYGDLLQDVTIYTTLESCTQCTGIMMLGRVKEVVYIQPDPTMYKIGAYLHTVTENEYLRAPRPIPAYLCDFDLQLDKQFDGFIQVMKDGEFFSRTPDSHSSSITSFLCTKYAYEAFSQAGKELMGKKLKDLKCKDQNKKLLREAKDFVKYATLKGERGTPHR